MHSSTSHSESETYVKHVSAFDTYHFEMSSLKSHASLARVNALDMSHLEMSPLNDVARRLKIPDTMVALDMSHSCRHETKKINKQKQRKQSNKNHICKQTTDNKGTNKKRDLFFYCGDLLLERVAAEQL